MKQHDTDYAWWHSWAVGLIFIILAIDWEALV